MVCNIFLGSFFVAGRSPVEEARQFDEGGEGPKFRGCFQDKMGGTRSGGRREGEGIKPRSSTIPGKEGGRGRDNNFLSSEGGSETGVCSRSV